MTAQSFPRSKPRSLWISGLYLVKRGLARLLGRRRAIGLALDIAWLTRRFAHELAGAEYGDAYLSRDARALSLDLLRQLLSPGMTLIDVGCGNGRWARAVAPHVKSVLAIDYDRDSIEYARRTAAPANVTFQHGDIRTDLGHSHFDVALVGHVLEHLDDVDGFLSSLRNISRMLIIEVPDFESDPLNAVRVELQRPFYSDADHVREYTCDQLRNDLERNGWKVCRVIQNHGCILAITEAASGG